MGNEKYTTLRVLTVRPPLDSPEPDETSGSMSSLPLTVLESPKKGKKAAELQGFFYLMYYRPTKSVKFGLSKNPALRRNQTERPPNAKRIEPMARNLIVAGLVPDGNLRQELDFHLKHRKDQLSPYIEWYAYDSEAIQDAFRLGFDFPEVYLPKPYRKSWLRRQHPGQLWSKAIESEFRSPSIYTQDELWHKKEERPSWRHADEDEPDIDDLLDSDVLDEYVDVYCVGN